MTYLDIAPEWRFDDAASLLDEAFDEIPEEHDFSVMASGTFTDILQ